MKIQNSFQLEFVANFSMHLENIHIVQSGSKDTKQRDRYTQLLEMINAAPFEQAYQNYQQIALADTDISNFSASQLRQARRLASLEMGLPAAD